MIVSLRFLVALTLALVAAACSASNAERDGTGRDTPVEPSDERPSGPDAGLEPDANDRDESDDGSQGASEPHVRLGVNAGRGQVEHVRAFEAWLGREVDVIGDALARATWATIEDPTEALTPWIESEFRDYPLMLTVPLLPAENANLERGVSGAYDQRFRQLGAKLVDLGYEDAILRLGHEANAEWFPWAAADAPDAYVEYWRRVADILDATPGADFAFDWSVARGSQEIDADRIYPGDDWVDYIGMDIYDRDPEFTREDGGDWQEDRWKKFLTQDFGLDWLVDFANERGKPISVTEWGLVSEDSRGRPAGDDNVYFVDRMYEWMHDNDIAYAVYFEVDADDGAHRLLRSWFPEAKERFRELWGAGASAR